MKLLPKRNWMYNIFAICSLALLFSCAQSGSTDVTEEIIEANVEFIAAFNANDAARLSMVYTEDATIYPPNSESISGREAIEEYWKAGFEAGVNNGNLTTDKAMARGDAAVETGTFEIFTADNNLIDKGKYMVVWKKLTVFGNTTRTFGTAVWHCRIPRQR